MKMTMSNDGIMRATITIKYRVGDAEREIIAFVNDYDAMAVHAEEGSPPFRLATRTEVIAALKGGYFNGFWREDEVQRYWEVKKPQWKESKGEE